MIIQAGGDLELQKLSNYRSCMRMRNNRYQELGCVMMFQIGNVLQGMSTVSTIADTCSGILKVLKANQTCEMHHRVINAHSTTNGVRYNCMFIVVSLTEDVQNQGFISG